MGLGARVSSVMHQLCHFNPPDTQAITVILQLRSYADFPLALIPQTVYYSKVGLELGKLVAKERQIVLP
jgi:hypothetical protein